jgi:hypothetical protein
MAARRVTIRLIHDGAQPGAPLDEALRFGLQDKAGEVHAGEARPDGVRRFETVLEIRGADRGAPPVFGGAFAQGPPEARFLYLSWKRPAGAAAPYGWRIKVPLAGVGWDQVEAAEAAGACLETDVRGRRPHETKAIVWRLARI